MRLYGAEGRTFYDALQAEEGDIAAEFNAAGLPAPVWSSDGKKPSITAKNASPQPWDAARETEQQSWLAAISNQFVNSVDRRRSGTLRHPS